MKPRDHVVLMAFVYFLVNMLQFVFGSILDTVASSLSISESLTGQLNTLYALGYAIGTPLLMVLTARLDHKTVFLFSELALVLGTAGTAVFPDFTTLLVIRAILGAAAGVCSATGTAIIARMVAPEARGKALFNLALGASVAFMLGMPASRWLVSLFDWRLLFALVAVLFLLALLLGLRTLPSSRGLAAPSFLSQVGVLRAPKVLAVLAACSLMFVGYSAVFTYVAPVLSGVSPTTGTWIGWIIMAMGIGSWIGSKAGGALVTRWGALNTMVVGVAGQVVFLGTVALVPHTEVVVVAGLVLWIMAAWMTGPTFNLVLITDAPEASGILLGLNTSAMQLGFAGGAALGGLALDLLTYQGLFWVSGGFTLIAGILAAVLEGRRRSATRRAPSA